MESQGRRRKGAEPRRDELVLAAYRLLAERGFEGLRTRDIAGAVGLNIATLHYYFPTKEALVRGVVHHALGRFRTTLIAKAGRPICCDRTSKACVGPAAKSRSPSR